MLLDNWDIVIGLEIHAQLNTKTKMFSSEKNAFEGLDNEYTSPVSLGMPGALPVVNEEAVRLSVKTGLALGCQIRERSVFSRKNYYYPDLPKGYQISQFDLPLCEHGSLEFYLDDKIKKVGITRAHMEEDAGKSQHIGEYSLINLNRAGVPLLEIVSEPEIKSPREAAAYARTMRSVLRYLEVCDGNLEEGSMRCDCNISLKPKGQKEFGTKVEIKNVNSFRFVEKSLEFEIKRQQGVLEEGGVIVQETRLFDPVKNITVAMRTKENADDYRYFPDPDLLPTMISEEYKQALLKTLPELPLERARRFQKEFSLPEYDSSVLTQERELADYFEQVVQNCGEAKQSSNWVMGEILRGLKEEKLEINKVPVSAKNLAELISLISNKTISGKIAKKVFAEMWTSGKQAQAIVDEQGLVQITDSSSVEALIDKVIANCPNQLEQYRSGKDKLFGFFVGQVMKESKGQANPDMVNQILKDKLKGES